MTGHVTIPKTHVPEILPDEDDLALGAHSAEPRFQQRPSGPVRRRFDVPHDDRYGDIFAREETFFAAAQREAARSRASHR